MTPVSDEAVGSLSAFHFRMMCTGWTRQVGQADVRTAARYAHLVDGHVIEAALRIGDLIEQSMNGTRSLNHNTKYDSESLLHD